MTVSAPKPRLAPKFATPDGEVFHSVELGEEWCPECKRRVERTARYF